MNDDMFPLYAAAVLLPPLIVHWSALLTVMARKRDPDSALDIAAAVCLILSMGYAGNGRPVIVGPIVWAMGAATLVHVASSFARHRASIMRSASVAISLTLIGIVKWESTVPRPASPFMVETHHHGLGELYALASYLLYLAILADMPRSLAVLRTCRLPKVWWSEAIAEAKDQLPREHS